MSTRPPILLGRHLLDRRGFLGHMATGMGGIALGALLAERGLLAAEDARGRRPAAARWRRSRRTSPARAKRVLHIFCTGAVSHLDTWDYKPELIKRHGQPMPGRREAVTFQGENGNLAQEPLDVPAAGRVGQDTSPTCCRTWPSCADDLCFVHSLTSKTNTHGPGEMFMSTGFTLEGFPSIGAWVSLRARDREPGPARLRGDPRPAGRPAARAGELDQRLPAGRLPGDGVQRRPADQPPGPPAGDRRPATTAAARDFLRLLNDEHLKRNPGDTELSARIAAYELAAPDAARAPRRSATCRGRARATQALYGLDDPNPLTAGVRPQLPARPPAARARRPVRHALQRRLRHGRGRPQLGRPPPDQVRLRPPRPDPRQAGRRPADRPEGPGPARRHARRLDHRVRPHAHVPEGDRGPRPQPQGLHRLARRRRASSAAFSFGATDEFGHQAVENVVDVHDFHATILHLLGLDHETLTYYHNGIQRRLTDVHGHVIREVLA